MVRVRAAWVKLQAGRELDTYLRSRAWHWTVKQNYALAADYAIRLLNRHPREPLALVVGEIAATRTGQDTFADKCREAQRRLCFIHDVASVTALLDTPRAMAKNADGPARAEVEALARDILTAAGEAESPSQAVSDERVDVLESEPLSETQAAVRRCSMRVNPQGAVAEVLQPRGSVHGRGLYAMGRLPPRAAILTDQALFVQRADEGRCAHCLHPVQGGPSSSGAVSCPHCDEETYCSAGCQEAAWSQYHACCCRSVNPTFAEWAAAMRETMFRDIAAPEDGSVSPLENSQSQARAALSCLAVAKLCAMATVQQVHPLALQGVKALRGTAEYEPSTALSEIGALAVTLSAALRQPFLYMEEILSLFAVLQTNEFLVPGGVALYPVLSLLNHSCDPNCSIVVSSGAGPTAGARPAASGDTRRTLVTLRDIRDGEQLYIDYNAHLTSTLDYEQRKALCSQRHFECFCAKCVRRE